MKPIPPHVPPFPEERLSERSMSLLLLVKSFLAYLLIWGCYATHAPWERLAAYAIALLLIQQVFTDAYRAIEISRAINWKGPRALGSIILMHPNDFRQYYAQQVWIPERNHPVTMARDWWVPAFAGRGLGGFESRSDYARYGRADPLSVLFSLIGPSFWFACARPSEVRQGYGAPFVLVSVPLIVLIYNALVSFFIVATGGANSVWQEIVRSMGYAALARRFLVLVALIVETSALSYWVLSSSRPSGFNQPLSKIDAIYFSVTTLTTTGFGDIQPLSEATRVLVSLQMLSGFALITVGLAAAFAKASLDTKPKRQSDDK